MSRFALSTFAVFLFLAPFATADTLKVKKGDTIQSVIDAAGAGDTVVVPKGTYVEVLHIPESKPGLKLLGKGVILEARPDGAPGSGTGITVHANDVTVRGFEIRFARNGPNPVAGNGSGFGLFSSGARSIIQQLIVRSCSAGGVLVAGADSVVEKLLVERVEGSGIIVAGMQSTVDQVIVDRALGDGIEVNARDVTVTRAKLSHCNTGVRVEAENVEVSKCQILRTQTFGLVAGFGGSVRLVENLVDGAAVGIQANAQLATVENNEVRNTSIVGIVVGGSTVKAVKNKVSGVFFAGTGLQVSGESVEVANNKVTDVGGVGLLVDAGSASIVGNRVLRCGLTGNLAAVLISGSSWQASHNKVLDSRGSAVWLNNSEDALFENNQIQGALSTGIKLQSTFQVTLLKNKISNVLGEGIQNFGTSTALQGNKVSKSRTPLTNDTDGSASLVDLGGNKFGKGASAAGAPPPEIID